MGGRGKSRAFLISEIKKKNQNPKLSNSLNRSLRSTHTQDLLPTTQHHHTHKPTHVHPQEEEEREHPEQKRAFVALSVRHAFMKSWSVGDCWLP